MSTKKLDSNAVAQLVLNASKGLLADHLSLELITRIRDLLPDEEEKEEKPPAQKKQYVVLVSDPNGVLANIDLAGWVLQIAEEESPMAIVENICEAAYGHNASKRGRMLPVQTIGEAIDAIPPRTMKQAGVWAKTREPVLVVRTSNEIPRTPSILSDDNRGGPRDAATEAPIWVRAIQIAKAGPVSTSKLQRELKISYNEAAQIMDRLDDEGIIDAATAAKIGGGA